MLVFDYAAGGDLEALIHGRGQGPHAAGGTPARCGPGPGGFVATEDDVAGAALSQGGLQREPQPSQLGAAAAAGGGGGCGPGPLAAGVVKAHMKALLEALMHCHEQVRAAAGGLPGRSRVHVNTTQVYVRAAPSGPFSQGPAGNIRIRFFLPRNHPPLFRACCTATSSPTTCC